MDRRSFLGTVTAATLLTRRLGWAADDHKIDRIGVQLYTVRSEIAKDFEGSLAKVASIGYKEVELAGFKMKDGKISYFDRDRKSTRLNSSHEWISYAVFCLKKKKEIHIH